MQIVQKHGPSLEIFSIFADNVLVGSRCCSNTLVSNFRAEKELGREDLELQFLRENLLERELKYRSHLGLFSVIPRAADCATACLPSRHISLAQRQSVSPGCGPVRSLGMRSFRWFCPPEQHAVVKPALYRFEKETHGHVQTRLF